MAVTIVGILAAAGWVLGGCGESDDEAPTTSAPTGSTAASGPVPSVTPSTSTSTSTAGPGPATSGATTVTTVGTTVGEPTVDYAVKVPDSIRQVGSAVDAARARGETDLSGLSNGLVHVNSAGAVEVVLHAAAPVGEAQLADLTRLGVEVIDNSQTPAVGGQPAGGLVQAWVPADRLPAVAGLPWILAVTPPSYPPTGG